MKKPLALLLSLVLTAGLLSACGKGDSPAASSSMPDEPSVSVIAPVEEPEPEPEPEPDPKPEQPTNPGTTDPGTNNPGGTTDPGTTDPGNQGGDTGTTTPSTN